MIRFFAGIVISFTVFFALDLLPWEIDVTNYSSSQLYFFLACTAAVSVFVATSAGAFVARSSFVVPSSVIALVAWLLAASFLSAASKAYDPSNVVPYIIGNAGGLSLTLCGAIFGALIGRRFSTPNEDNASSAA